MTAGNGTPGADPRVVECPHFWGPVPAGACGMCNRLRAEWAAETETGRRERRNRSE